LTPTVTGSIQSQDMLTGLPDWLTNLQSSCQHHSTFGTCTQHTSYDCWERYCTCRLCDMCESSYSERFSWRTLYTIHKSVQRNGNLQHNNIVREHCQRREV